MENDPMKKFFLALLISSLVISAFMGIILILIGTGEIQSKILLTTLAFAGFTGLGMIYKGFKPETLMITGFMLSIMGFIAATIAIWGQVTFGISEIISSSTILLLTQLSIKEILKHETNNRILKNITTLITILTSILGIMISILIFQQTVSNFFYKIMGIFGILIVLGFVLRPILEKVFNQQQTSQSI